jgi:PAS domain S-box-containing protein
MTSSPVRSTASRRSAAALNTPVRLLVGVCALCLALVFGLRGYFDQREQQIRQRGDNERARLFVGEEIVRSIHAVEKDFYRLAATRNDSGLARIHQAIAQNLDKLEHDLKVLKNGGTTQRLMQLNLDGQDEVTREASYHPEAGQQALVMELIEIAPQVKQIRQRTQDLLLLLGKRSQALVSGQASAFLVAEEEVMLALKSVPPQFERINENANRLFLEGDVRLQALQAELNRQSAHLRQVETALISLVVVLGSTLVLLLLRGLATALEDTRRARDATESQREQNATILDTLSDGVYTTDLQGNISYLNAAAQRLLGWQASELIGRNAHATLHHQRPDGRPFPAEECPLNASLRAGETSHGEAFFVHRDGHCFAVDYGSKPLRLEGQLVGSLLAFQDITERLSAQAQIRLQQAALDAAANAIVITNREGFIEYVNPAFTRTTGYSAAEALGQSTRLLKSGEHDPAFYRKLWQTLNAGQTWEGELDNRRKNGEIYPEQMTVTPIFENGEISHFVAIKRDISEARHTRTRLKLIESAIAETKQGVYILGAAAEPKGALIQYVNASFSRITGFSAQVCVGASIDMLRGPQTEPDRLEQIRTSMAQGLGISTEITYHHKDGSPYVAELQLSPLHNDRGQLTHYVGLLSDIGLRKQAEAALLEARDQALENSRLKSEFLSTMSHEIRTPMNGIIGMTDLLLDTELDDEQREFTAIVHDSAQDLMVIINDILDFSKIEAGKLVIENTEFSLEQVLEGPLELLGAGVREKSLTLTTLIDPELPALLVGEPVRLRQVLLNIVGNAVKFTQQGGVSISVRPEQPPGGPALRIEVSDTGIGIAPQNQARLFQSFTQADSSTTRKYGGTGLGLAISKRLVELMGGQIGVISQAGQGSTFWLTLPLVAAGTPVSGGLTEIAPQALPLPVPVSLSSPQLAPMARPATGGPLILLAEDNPVNQRLTQYQVNKLGYNLQIVGNGQMALDLLARSAAGQAPAFAAVLMDCQMPVMDGFEATANIRHSERPGQRRLPIIAMTANAMQGDRERCVAAGMDDYLSKPIQIDSLRQLLAKWAGPPLLPPGDLPTPPAAPEPPTVSQAAAELTRAKANAVASADRREAQQVAALAHELKGSAGNLGLETLTGLAARLEARAGDSDWPHIDRLQPQLMAAFADLQTLVKGRQADPTHLTPTIQKDPGPP